MFNNQNNSSNVRLIYDIMMPSYFPSAVLINKRWVEEEITSARCLVLFFFYQRNLSKIWGESEVNGAPQSCALHNAHLPVCMCQRTDTRSRLRCTVLVFTHSSRLLPPASNTHTHTDTLMQKPYPHSYTHTQSDGQDDGV